MSRSATALLALLLGGCVVRVKVEHRWANGLRCEARRGLVSAELVCRPHPMPAPPKR